jgi:hypothetical protein
MGGWRLDGNPPPPEQPGRPEMRDRPANPGNGPQGRPGMNSPAYGPMGGFGMRRPDIDVVEESKLDRTIADLCKIYREWDPRPNTTVAYGDKPTPDFVFKSRDEVQKQIEQFVTKQFEMRQSRRQKELTRFEDQIKRLRETIEKREKAKTEIIDRRVKELLELDDDMKF